MALNVETLERIKSRIQDKNVTLVAVTKTRTSDEINPLLDHGIADIGENRVQHWLEKRDQINPGFRLHIIGHLQRNKVKYVVPGAYMIQSVDNELLLAEINKYALRYSAPVNILLQVNTAREPQKSGVLEEDFPKLFDAAQNCGGVRLRGLMCMAPLEGGLDAAREAFDRAYALYTGYKPRAGADFDTLSMGMSGDYETAIGCGATMIRLGRILFEP